MNNKLTLYGLDATQLASVLGCSVMSAYRKINQITDLTMEEAHKLVQKGYAASMEQIYLDMKKGEY